MSKFQEARTRSFVAGADLSAAKYLAVKTTATPNEVILAGAGEGVGILMNSPKAGEYAEVAMNGGGAQCVAGAAVAIGDLVASDAAGKLIPALAGNKVLGIALSAAALNEYFEIDRTLAEKA